MLIPFAEEAGRRQYSFNEGYDSKLKPVQQVTARLGNLAYGVITAGAHSIDTVGAAAGGALAILSLGTCKPVNKFAFSRLNSWGNFLPDLFKSVTLLVNPKARFPDQNERKELRSSRGYFSTYAENLYDAGVSNDHIGGLKNTVVARIQFAGSIVAFTAARIADTLLGVLAGIRALALGGLNQTYNREAYAQLNITRLPLDLTKSIIHLFNPWAKLPVDMPEIANDPFEIENDPLLVTH